MFYRYEHYKSISHMALIVAIVYIQIYTEHNQRKWMNFNERTNTLLYKNTSLTLYYRKGWCWLCVGDELETGTDSYIDPAVLLSHLGWVAQPWLTEGPKLSVCCWLSIRHLVSNWLKSSVPWLYYCSTSTYFCCSSHYLRLYRWFNKGIPQVQAEELASLSESD